MYTTIITQRRRYLELQEQHADLLGLLAQQEVELSVFRGVLEQSSGGDEQVRRAEEKSQLMAIKKYGTYTNFRPNFSSSFDNFSIAAPDSVTSRYLPLPLSTP